ncbi:MAG: hypothetical protein RL392_919 [Pseudomonadota bacterium]
MGWVETSCESLPQQLSNSNVTPKRSPQRLTVSGVFCCEGFRMHFILSC